MKETTKETIKGCSVIVIGAIAGSVGANYLDSNIEWMNNWPEICKWSFEGATAAGVSITSILSYQALGDNPKLRRKVGYIIKGTGKIIAFPFTGTYKITFGKLSSLKRKRKNLKEKISDLESAINAERTEKREWKINHDIIKNELEKKLQRTEKDLSKAKNKTHYIQSMKNELDEAIDKYTKKVIQFTRNPKRYKTKSIQAFKDEATQIIKLAEFYSNHSPQELTHNYNLIHAFEKYFDIKLSKKAAKVKDKELENLKKLLK